MNSMKRQESRRSPAWAARPFPTAPRILSSKFRIGIKITPRNWTTKVASERGVASKEPSMPQTFDWDNFEDIAIALTDKFPDVEPYSVRFTDMQRWITELPAFAADPARSRKG